MTDYHTLIQGKRDSKLITVFAEQVQGKAHDYSTEREQAEIMAELSKDLTPENRHQIAQIMSFTIERLQEKTLDPFSPIADIKNIGYGDKAVFKFKDKDTIRSYKQAKGSTTARSYAAPEQTFTMDTYEISARPAIHMGDLRTGRINMSDLIKEANEHITRDKVREIQTCLQSALQTKSSPYYAAGLTKANLDAEINHFRRLGQVALMGDYAMTSKIANFAGWAPWPAAATTNPQVGYWQEGINEYNRTGIIGQYNGCPIITMQNTYKNDEIVPVLDHNWLYVLPAGIGPEYKNLKIVNEGGVQSMDSTNIDDMTFEVRLDVWYGVAFFDRAGIRTAADTKNPQRRITIAGIYDAAVQP